MVIFYTHSNSLKYCSICFVFFLLFRSVAAQDFSGYPVRQVKKFEQIRQEYNNRNFASALIAVDELIGKKPNFIEAYLLKSDILHEMNRLEAEISCYQQILQLDSVSFPRVYFLMGNVQREIGEYQEAEISYSHFIPFADRFASLKEKTIKGIEACRFAIKQKENPVYFFPVSMGDSINTGADEYWPSLSMDGKTIVFTRLVSLENSLSGRKSLQEDFFISTNQNGDWISAKPITSVNTSENEGAQSISADANWLFFTACSRSDSWGGCDLYYSRREGDHWSAPRNMGSSVNSRYWESQPSIAGNKEYLYFVSNRPGGKGGMDIWRCHLLSCDGANMVWGKAENLGDSINTPGNEMSPFIHPDGETLYFSSDYWPGMGGDDLFFSKMKADAGWSTPVNLGYPINTWHDERGVVVSVDGKKAYYSSDVVNNMDIYEFEMPELDRPLPVTYAQGSVVDANTGKALKAAVELVEIENPKHKITMTADDNGRFLLGLPLGSSYMLNVVSSGYLFYSENFALKQMKSVGNPFLLAIKLYPIEPGKTVVLKNIFYATDSWQLLPESIAELNELVNFMENNPAVKIEIGGHTDNVGGMQYNLELSTQRAQAVFDYLITAGINKRRLAYHGYGYSVPVESNETEVGRAVNRRTEFKIIE